MALFRKSRLLLGTWWVLADSSCQGCCAGLLQASSAPAFDFLPCRRACDSDILWHRRRWAVHAHASFSAFSTSACVEPTQRLAAATLHKPEIKSMLLTTDCMQAAGRVVSAGAARATPSPARGAAGAAAEERAARIRGYLNELSSASSSSQRAGTGPPGVSGPSPARPRGSSTLPSSQRPTSLERGTRSAATTPLQPPAAVRTQAQAGASVTDGAPIQTAPAPLGAAPASPRPNTAQTTPRYPLVQLPGGIQHDSPTRSLQPGRGRGCTFDVHAYSCTWHIDAEIIACGSQALTQGPWCQQLKGPQAQQQLPLLLWLNSTLATTRCSAWPGLWNPAPAVACAERED